MIKALEASIAEMSAVDGANQLAITLRETLKNPAVGVSIG